MTFNHLILCRPLLLLPSIFPSIRGFSNESVLPIRWPKDWSFSFSISPSNEYSGLISFRMVWLDLLAVQGTLKSQTSYITAHLSGLRCWDITVTKQQTLFRFPQCFLFVWLVFASCPTRPPHPNKCPVSVLGSNPGPHAAFRLSRIQSL